ncbi:unnamed protein product [Musa acuminata subsp. malaccensis]|uniref:(wild Malaysian banana) hypothetical protein n=1 Tax=Musa acuminata subsp. malaccensis TaxID=214687 RepID=A0A8D7BGB0_MUSAM|nr:unnamed protein product [Musa acuminata subsp. malaccensis]
MDAKKKKNKKKKGNQNKVAEDATSNSEKVAVQESNNGSGLEENCNAHNSTDVHGQNVGVSESDMEHDKNKIYEENFAKLQEQVRELEYEKALWFQKQAIYAPLKANLEEKIKVLQEEVYLCAQKEVITDYHAKCHHRVHLKLAIFHAFSVGVEYVEAFVEEKLKNVESIKDSLVLTEISLKERIARVEEASTALDTQVKELQGLRNTFFEENQQLMEKVTGLEKKIQSIEERAPSHENLTETMTKLPEDDFSAQQTEASSALFGDQTSGSTELSEKVNEPYIIPEKHGGHPSGTDLNGVEMLDRASSPSHYVSDFREKIKDSGETVHPSVQLQENFGANNGINDLDSETVNRPGPPPSDEPRGSEPATVPFDEIQIHKEDFTGVQNNEIAEAVPLSDAPLIGAPFRLISFMAKYVSGADLVKQNSSRSGH